MSNSFWVFDVVVVLKCFELIFYVNTFSTILIPFFYACFLLNYIFGDDIWEKANWFAFFAFLLFIVFDLNGFAFTPLHI